MAGFLFGALPRSTAAQNAQFDSAVNSAMVRWRAPGAVIAVIRNGQPILAKGYGFANLAKSIHATPSSQFYIGSMSKQFTATAVMMLMEEGRIRLDDRARKYLPQLPVAYDAITVHQLLNHTSGIQRDFRENENSLTGTALYRALAGSPLAFAPGTMAGYSNTEYILLGLMVEAVAGQTLSDFLKSRVFVPLGMTATLSASSSTPPPGVAVGYEWSNSGYQVVNFVPIRLGAGAIISTAADLIKWDASLRAATLLKRSSLQMMSTPGRTSDGNIANIGADDAGRLLESGMGWFSSVDLGHHVVHHGGNIDGYSSQIERFVDDSVTIIVLANNEFHSAINIARTVIAQLIPRLDSVSTTSLAQLGRAALGDARYAEAARYFTKSLAQGDTIPTSAFNAARSFAQLALKDSAFAYLGRAASLHYANLERLNTERSLNALRSDSRWADIVRRITANSLGK